VPQYKRLETCHCHSERGREKKNYSSSVSHPGRSEDEEINSNDSDYGSS
jgi:hypothetical protein